MHTNKSQANKKGSRWLIVVMLAVTFSQNYYDLIRLLEDSQLALYAHDGPIIAKIGKDLCYFLIIASIIINFKKFRATPSFGVVALIFYLVIFMIIISAYYNGLIVALIGFRWLLPFLIFLLIGEWSKNIDKEFFSKIILISLIACLTFQVIQLFIMPPIFGEIFFGLAARTPGYFIAPNSAAFFGCSCAGLVLVVHGYRGKMAFTALLTAFCISALAQSGTGLIVASLLIFWYFIYPNLKLYIIGVFFFGPLIFSNLNLLTGRDNYVEISGGGRLEVLQHIFYDSIGSLTTFGKYTNAANLISENPENQVALDSLIAAWIGNFGVLWPLATILTILFIIFNIHQFNKNVFGPAMVFLLFSMTTIVFEAFPMNLILALSIWWSRAVKPVCKFV
ncbi:MAG: hypothetical protein QM533_00585 [Cytophagales bacterium]|nr:hypothetical protein [Cytophagales bacterium]